MDQVVLILGWMMMMITMMVMVTMMVGWRQLVGGTMSTLEWIDSAALHRVGTLCTLAPSAPLIDHLVQCYCASQMLSAMYTVL